MIKVTLLVPGCAVLRGAARGDSYTTPPAVTEVLISAEAHVSHTANHATHRVNTHSLVAPRPGCEVYIHQHRREAVFLLVAIDRQMQLFKILNKLVGGPQKIPYISWVLR